MKAVRIDLSKDLDRVEIHTFADLHLGDKGCDVQLIKQRIEEVKNNPNAYCILNGDIINNATKTSISDCYAEELKPMEQIQLFVGLFEPIKDKILAITNGNHENRTYVREGVDITALCTRQLGIDERYSKEGILIFLRFGKQNSHLQFAPVRYVIYATHGSGGGRKEGGKAIRLADMASIVDADIYIHSHTHLPMIMKEAFYRTDDIHSTFALVDKLFINTSSYLNYGGYGQSLEFKPNSKDTPVIYLDGTQKRFTAKL